MNLKILTLLFVLFIFYLTKSLCNNKEKDYPDLMLKAIHYIDTNPDSTLFLLSSLDSVIVLEPEETRMYYALMKMRAEDKLNKRHTSDSLIVRIVEFYKQTHNKEKLLEAYYLLGRVYRDMGDAPRALSAFHHALKIGVSTTRYDLMARIYEHQNYLYAYQGLYPEALSAIVQSRHYYQLSQHTAGIALSYRNQARIFDRLGQTDSMEIYYRKSYEFAFNNHETYIYDYVLDELISVYMDHGMIEKGINLLPELSEQVKQKSSLAPYNLGIAYHYKQQRDSAIYYLQKAIQGHNVSVQRDSYRVLAQIEAEQMHFRQAYNALCKGWERNDSIMKRTQTEALAKVHALYNYQHINKEKYKLKRISEKRLFLIYIFGGLTIISIAFVIIIAQRLRYKKQKAITQERLLRMIQAEELKKSLQYIEEKENELYKMEQQMNEQDCYYRQLLDLQRKELEISKQQALIFSSNRQQQKVGLINSSIYKRFLQAGSEQRNVSENDWHELQQALDLAYPQFSERLFLLYPKMSEKERRICCLIKLSVPNNQMAVILCCTPSTITQARKRLYKKITGEDGSGEKLDRIITDL
ncbi:MAG: hypothetical protein SOR57_01550 [Parabacteroides sp.]|nr:hypothetical protein [Parabacteroides sp.]